MLKKILILLMICLGVAIAALILQLYMVMIICYITIATSSHIGFNILQFFYLNMQMKINVFGLLKSFFGEQVNLI